MTNDFPPKIGGIQNYLWELWRRLPPDRFSVVTSPHRDAARFDAEQPFEVRRLRDPVLLPRPGMVGAIDGIAREFGAELVVLDPALPIGHVGPRLELPYGVVLHGAEVTVPGRLPVSRRLLARVLRGAQVVISAGHYAAVEAERAAGVPLPVVEVPPGVDTGRFVPVDAARRRELRARLGVPVDARLVVGVSRLVPRKGFDQVIRAVADLRWTRPDVHAVIVGGGRDRRRLERLAARLDAPVTFLGRVSDDDLVAAYAMGDVVAMLCRDRWFGLEREGFGIVFLEAAASGVPQVAGASGGSQEAVADGRSGLVVDAPRDLDEVVSALARLLDDEDEREKMGDAARQRVVEEFSYEVLASRLEAALS